MTFDEYWANANPDAESGSTDTLDPPADGVYEVAMTSAAAFTSKDDVPWVKTSFKDVVSGYEWTVLHGFKSQAQANVTKKTCRTLGVLIDQVTSQDGLDEALKSCVGTFYAVTVKTNGQYRNTYVDGVAGSAPAGDFPAAPAPSTAEPGMKESDEVPF